MSKNKILVTGSDGFIGSHLVEKQLRNGHVINKIIITSERMPHFSISTQSSSNIFSQSTLFDAHHPSNRIFFLSLPTALTTSDFVFFGHDHKAESIITNNGDGAIFNIIMG